MTTSTSALIAASLFIVTVVCRGSNEPPLALGQKDVLASYHWISYAPMGYFPRAVPPVVPTAASVRADLKTLRNAGFTGLVTYGSDVENIPDVAERVGFKAMLLGIWDPSSLIERSRALTTVKKHDQLIVGIIVGNEGLQTGRYSLEALCTAMKEIHAATRKPISTTETVEWVLAEPKIADCSQFITVNAHPYFSNQKTPREAVKWTEEAWNSVQSQYRGKPILFKEVGLPTAGDKAVSEQTQSEYYKLLSKTAVTFSYFEAFDATRGFKEGAIEQSWGLWKANRAPKAAVHSLPWNVGSPHDHKHP
jgi:exo-beta-1,3-glucanase (GH17 family)